MITLSNLRKEQAGDWTRLICDFTWSGDTPNPFTEKTIWFSVKNENADFFSTKVYDPFLLVPYYAAMRYGQDLKICGKVSAKLYHNLTNYIQQIFLDFSDELHPVKLEVEGFDTVEQYGTLVGAGFSCGVDSLSTVYDHFVKEPVPGYKINSLFLFNCGGNGYIERDSTRKLYQTRYERNKKAADELGLPLYQVESNLHAYTGVLGIYKLTYLSNWSCIISLQRKVYKYYVASSLSYEEVIRSHKIYHDKDIDDFCGIYLVPRIQTESLELIYDGAQHRRTEKVALISDWDIAQNNLYVCLTEEATDGNCSQCDKCLRTMFTIDILGKTNLFANVFNWQQYQKLRKPYILTTLYNYNKSAHASDNIDFAREHQIKLPPVCIAYIYMAPHFIFSKTKVLIKRLIGEERAKQLKQKVRRNRVC